MSFPAQFLKISVWFSKPECLLFLLSLPETILCFVFDIVSLAASYFSLLKAQLSLSLSHSLFLSHTHTIPFSLSLAPLPTGLRLSLSVALSPLPAPCNSLLPSLPPVCHSRLLDLTSLLSSRSPPPPLCPSLLSQSLPTPTPPLPPPSAHRCFILPLAVPDPGIFDCSTCLFSTCLGAWTFLCPIIPSPESQLCLLGAPGSLSLCSLTGSQHRCLRDS